MKNSVRTLMENGRLWAGSFDSPRGRSSLRASSSAQARFQIPEIDNTFPDNGLAFGKLHEWSLQTPFCSKSKNIWFPPLLLVSALLGKTFVTSELNLPGQKNIIAWIGRRAWPTPNLLAQTFTDFPWQENSLFLRPENAEERLWAITQLLQHPQTTAVIADGSRFSLVATRRLQLAAQKEQPLLFLFRPPWEMQQPSTAYSRWRIRASASGNNEQHFLVELLSAKGVLPDAPWILEWKEANWDNERYETGSLHLVGRAGSNSTGDEEIPDRRASSLGV